MSLCSKSLLPYYPYIKVHAKCKASGTPTGYELTGKYLRPTPMPLTISRPASVSISHVTPIPRLSLISLISHPYQDPPTTAAAAAGTSITLNVGAPLPMP